jgi:hypothetical protein
MMDCRKKWMAALLATFILGVAGISWAAATAVLAPVPKFTAIDSNGDPWVGAKLYTYETGGTTPKSTWTDSTKVTPNTNPVVLDSYGQANVWLDASGGAYRLKLLDPDDITIWTVDGVQDASSAAFEGLGVMTNPIKTDKFVVKDVTAGTIKTLDLEDLLGNVYYPNPAAVDQGDPAVVGTLAYWVTTIGVTNQATIVLRHNSGSATTTYTLTTSETIPSNITLKVERGAVIDGAGTLTINGGLEAGCYKIFGTSLTVTGIPIGYPEWWGAIKDDNTKDAINTVAINAAITAVNVTNGSVIISNGIWYVASDIILLPGVDLVGTSRLGSILQRTGTGTSVITMGNASTHTSMQSTISNLSVYGGVGGGGVYSDYCIYLNDVDQVEIDSVNVKVSAVAGIMLTAGGGKYTVIVNIHDSYIESNYGNGIETSTASSINAVTITNNRIYGNANYGIYVNCVTVGWNITGNDIEGNGGVSQVFFVTMLGLNMSGNYFEQSTAGHVIDIARSSGLSITGNNFQVPTGYSGIRLGYPTYASSALQISGNRFVMSDTADVAITTGPGQIADFAIGPNSLSGTTYHATIFGVTTTSNILTDHSNDILAGTGTTASFARIGGVLYRGITPVGTPASGVQTTLMTYTLRKGVLDVDGKAIRVTAFGTTGANANTKRIILSFGTTGIVDTGAIAANGKNWRISAVIMRTGATTQIANGVAKISTDLDETYRATPTNTLANELVILVSGINGAPVADDIVQEGMIIELLN